MDGLVGGSVLRPTSRNLEMIISVYGYLRLSRSLFDFTLETIMVWMIWTAITDDSLACNVLNVRTDVRIDMSFPALVSIDGVTITALLGHLINRRTLTVAVKKSTQLNTAQHNSTQLNTTQHSSTQLNTAQHNSTQLNTLNRTPVDQKRAALSCF